MEKVAPHYDPPEEPVMRRVVDAVLRDIAVGHVVSQPAAELGPLRVERGHRQQVGNIEPFHHPARLRNEVANLVEPLDVDGMITDRKSTRLNSSHANISYAV